MFLIWSVRQEKQWTRCNKTKQNINYFCTVRSRHKTHTHTHSLPPSLYSAWVWLYGCRVTTFSLIAHAQQSGFADIVGSSVQQVIWEYIYFISEISGGNSTQANKKSHFQFKCIGFDMRSKIVVSYKNAAFYAQCIKNTTFNCIRSSLIFKNIFTSICSFSFVRSSCKNGSSWTGKKAALNLIHLNAKPFRKIINQSGCDDRQNAIRK